MDPLTFEVRESGQKLHGVILTEGRAASGGRAEVFTPNAVKWPPDGVAILADHRGAELARAVPERAQGGEIRVSVPATPAIRAAIQSGKRFMSVEFKPIEERTTPGGVREILSAMVDRAALVSGPEYDSTSAEIRRRSEFYMRSRMTADKPYRCHCLRDPETGRLAGHSTADRGGGVWMTLSLDAVYEAAQELAELDNLIAHRGSLNAGDIVASTAAGTLQVVQDKKDLLFSLTGDVALSKNGRELTEASKLAGAPPLIRPVFDEYSSIMEKQPDGTWRYTSLAIRSILIKHVSGWRDTGGWETELPDIEPREALKPEPWLWL